MGVSGWKGAGEQASRRALGWSLRLGAVMLGHAVHGGPRLGLAGGAAPLAGPSDLAGVPSLQLPLLSPGAAKSEGQGVG